MSCSSAVRVDLVSQYGWLPNAIARDIAAGLPCHVDIEDLKQNGFVGLMDAARKYSPDHGVQFQSYARFRIRGAILDGLRALDWASRDTRRLQKQLSAASAQLTGELGREPDVAEVAERLGIDVAAASCGLQNRGICNISASARSGALEDLAPEFEASVKDAPDAICSQHELQAAIERAMSTLPEQYRLMIRLYYFNGTRMKEIGKRMGVKESRISQIKRRALRRMKEALRAEGISSADEMI